MHPTDQRNSRWLWAAFTASALCGAGMFFIPAFIIRPFRYQAPRALWLAMSLRQRAPLGTMLCALFCLLLVVALWRGSRLWSKLVLTIAILLTGFSAVMARMNYFEWMFHPVDSAQFEAESQSKLDASEMVMTVRFGNDARAYPIREMAYHHVLNDWVGGVPVAVTY
jgi:xanthine/uracil/vitamin C permease (AzgA family)